MLAAAERGEFGSVERGVSAAAVEGARAAAERGVSALVALRELDVTVAERDVPSAAAPRAFIAAEHGVLAAAERSVLASAERGVSLQQRGACA